MDPELRLSCESYIKAAFNEDDQKQIQALLDADKHDELRKRMMPRITFGTSGLRGRMEAGYARMNDLTVFQTSLGLRDYILATVPNASTRGIVIGHDHRHNSARFAQVVEAVFAPAMKIYVFGTLVHTPLVPFSVKTLRAACGVMITASHNPKRDNGYKVYGENSCAIIPPHDSGISDAILRAIAQAPDGAKPELGASRNNVENVYEQMTKAYFGSVFALIENFAPDTSASQQHEFKFVYTPMHGVGLIYARVAMSASPSSSNLGKSEMIVVAEQSLPDPEFPTVAFPNPEESGALDLAMQTADKEDISIVVATDPDADRLGVAEKIDGHWTVLTGDQIGVLLADYLMTHGTAKRKRAVLSSAVSSRMLEIMAANAGIHWEETLTGFKWLGNKALELREAGYDVIFSYEEAIGFMVGDIVYDKDGILAMTVLLQLARTLYARKATLTSQLALLYQQHGFFASANSYFTTSSPTQLEAVMRALRTPEYPKTLGHRTVARVRDMTNGYDSMTESHEPTLPTSKSSEMLTFFFAPSADATAATLTIRGSGTEPKIKYYIDVQHTDKDSANKAARGIEEDLINYWLKDFTLQQPARH